MSVESKQVNRCGLRPEALKNNRLPWSPAHQKILRNCLYGELSTGICLFLTQRSEILSPRKIFARVLRSVRSRPHIPYDEQDMDSQYQPFQQAYNGDGRAQRGYFTGLSRHACVPVGIMTSLIAIPRGCAGCLAGYFGGWIDDLIVWLYSTMASMPGILL